MIAAKTGRTVPSLKSVAQSPVYLQFVQAAGHHEVFLNMGPFLALPPQIGTWPDIELRANNGIQEAFYGGITVDQAITEIEQGTTARLQLGNFPNTLVVPTPQPGKAGEDD